jgi:hypothetical protein
MDKEISSESAVKFENAQYWTCSMRQYVLLVRTMLKPDHESHDNGEDFIMSVEGRWLVFLSLAKIRETRLHTT